MEVREWLRRVGWRGSPPPPNLAALRALVAAHQENVPFENLDVAIGRVIRIDPEAWFEKVVRRRRGGFCYELNGLFGMALRELGFETAFWAGAVHSGNGAPHPFDHCCVGVLLDDRWWLADVGFEDTFHGPLCLDDEQGCVRHGGDEWRVRSAPSLQGSFSLESRKAGDADFRLRYEFSTQPRALHDFADRCAAIQCDPASVFTKGPFVTKATADGRLTLTTNKLVRLCDGRREEVPISGAEEFAAMLRQHFGIDWDAL